MGSKKMTVDADTEVNTTALASILGVTARRVQQMAQDGTIVSVKRGTYQLGDAVQRYIRFKEESKVSDDEVLEAEKKKLISDANLKEAKSIIAAAEAEEIRGNMHRAEDVELLTNDMIYTIRSALNALPGRVAVDVTACETAAEASNVIRKEVHKIMRELAEYKYDPEKYAELVRERREWTGGADDSD